MARPLRLELPGAIYHVTARGNERQAIYRDDGDRRTFLETLERVLSRFRWRCLAYCLMGNHYHLLIETPQPNLARGMRQLNGVYAQRFNRRHGRVGHLLQGRYGAVLVERGSHLLAAARYVVRNPVRAGLRRHPADWRWSSYRATLGLEPPGFLALEALLAHFGETRVGARACYRAFVEQEGDEVLEPRGVILGSDRFVEERTADLLPSAEVPRNHWRPLRPSVSEIVRARAQDEAIAVAYRDHGYPMREIAAALGCHYATVSRRLRSFEQRELSG